MKKYVKPSYENACVETEDVILASIMISDAGEGSLGNITGKKGNLEADFSAIFGNL